MSTTFKVYFRLIWVDGAWYMLYSHMVIDIQPLED